MTESSVRELAPFNFFAGYRSAIRSLGGVVKGPDPKYGFHTEYHELRPGPVIFRIAFDELAVSFGELEIHLNAYVPGSGKNALKATGTKISMAELQRTGGSFEITGYAVKGATYGLYGFFPDGTDATASGIMITVEERGRTEEGCVPAEAFEPTRFGLPEFHRPSRLIEGERLPTFADPVSQLETPNQLEEAAFAARISELRLAGAMPNMWHRAFILQVMKRYGFFESGAKGLCLGDQDAGLAAFLADQGSPILFGTDIHHGPALGAGDIPTSAYLSVAEMDYENLTADLRGFDFLWSVGTGNQMGGVRETSTFVEQAMRALRPGGLAIHIFDISPSIKNLALEDRVLSDTMLRRDDIIRIAVTLISRSHEVAQMNFGDWIRRSNGPEAKSAPSLAEVVPFGLIIRKGPG